MVMYTLLYLKWITNKVLQYSTRNSAQCYVVAWMGRSLGENGDTCICMAEPLCCPPETITVLLIGYIPIQNRRRQWHPIPVLLTGKSHGLRSLVGCSPWGHEESDTTQRRHFHFQYKIKRLNFKKIFKETIHVEQFEHLRDRRLGTQG